MTKKKSTGVSELTLKVWTNRKIQKSSASWRIKYQKTAEKISAVFYFSIILYKLNDSAIK